MFILLIFETSLILIYFVNAIIFNYQLQTRFIFCFKLLLTTNVPLLYHHF